MKAEIENGVLRIYPETQGEASQLYNWADEAIVPVESILPEEPNDDVCVKGKHIFIEVKEWSK